jgi:hypothetical protein
MTPKLPRLFPLIFLLSAPALWAAPAGGLASEYDQVRKIALRDSKVQGAFAKANKTLENKIIDLDPALKDYAKAQKPLSPEEMVARQGAPRSMAPHPSAAHTSAPAPAVRKPVMKPFRAAPVSKKTHTLGAGETLGSVAAKYGVKVADLRRVNKIKDERRLAVGQVLAIPASKSAAPAF